MSNTFGKENQWNKTDNRIVTAIPKVGIDRAEYIKMIFPAKLALLLKEAEKQEFNDVISWLPDGKRFKVHDKERFTNNIMSAFFPSCTKYKSYQRSLNLWGYTCAPKGPEKGICSHPFFIRDDPSKMKRMKRVKVKGATAKAVEKLQRNCLEASNITVALATSALPVPFDYQSIGKGYGTSVSIDENRLLLPCQRVVSRFSDLTGVPRIMGEQFKGEVAMSIQGLLRRERAIMEEIAIVQATRDLLDPRFASILADRNPRCPRYFNR